MACPASLAQTLSAGGCRTGAAPRLQPSKLFGRVSPAQSQLGRTGRRGRAQPEPWDVDGSLSAPRRSHAGCSRFVTGLVNGTRARPRSYTPHGRIEPSPRRVTGAPRVAPHTPARSLGSALRRRARLLLVLGVGVGVVDDHRVGTLQVEPAPGRANGEQEDERRAARLVELPDGALPAAPPSRRVGPWQGPRAGA
jgi:hypothetical protein